MTGKTQNVIRDTQNEIDRKLKRVTCYVLRVTCPQGFTLIEILVSVSILVILAVIGSNMFFSLMKGAVKTKVLNLVKQEGNYALSVMERTIRNAARLEECGDDYVAIRNQDGGQTTFLFCPDPEFLIAVGSETLVCDEARSNEASLTSDKVRLTSYSLACTPPPSELDSWVVEISFTLSQAAATPRPEEQASVDFRTTISLRNLL